MSGLAISALGYFLLEPCVDDFPQRFFLHAFESCDFFVDGIFDGGTAGECRFAVDVHGAASAEAFPASEFCSFKSDCVSDNPEQRSGRVNIDRVFLFVNGKI